METLLQPDLPRSSVSPISPADGLTEIHSLPARQVYEMLETRPEGLTGVEALERLGRFGRKVIGEIRGKPLLLKLLANFTHLMAILLWIGGLIGFLAGMPQLGVAIWMVNLINGAFSFWQEYKAEKATEALRRLLPTYARVLREGAEVRIPAEKLVPGDILLLSEGDHVSADARLVKETELRVDQSPLTGESHPTRKTCEAAGKEGLSRAEISNLVFAGTGVAAGTGIAVVFATGMQTEFGKIARLTQSVGEGQSPLQKEMVRMTRMVTFLATGTGFLFFGLAIAIAGMGLAESFIFALGMIVAFVPEGLLPTVSLSLAMGVQRMARRNALVKRLSAVETLGCTTVICTDKTGTLTQNEMTVREIWVGGLRLSVTGVGYAPEGVLLAGAKPVSVADTVTVDLRPLLLAAGLCNNARLVPPVLPSASWSVLGDPTEAALRVVALKGGVDLAAEATSAPRLRELPFDSRRKRMATVHKSRGRLIAYVKGAPGEVLQRCTRVRMDGREQPMTDEARARIGAVHDEYARTGLRVLAVAERALPDDLGGYTPEEIECDLVFLGLMGMMDPPRPEVAEAVRKCHNAGIRVVMITGDYGLTAENVARRIGILRGSEPSLVSGADLETMEDGALAETLRGEVLLARVTPEHKLRVVRVLREMGHVVAVTGDGVNDAPALKQADIGVAMGLSGTDVAKEAADMVLADDNFASIVHAVEEGRAVYANIKKFITYIFTSNTPEAVPFICFVLSGGRIPLALNVMQILSIDLGTDIMPALALGAEPPEPGLMDRPPRRLHEHAITWPLLLRAYAFLGLLQSFAAMTAFYFLFWRNGYWGQWLGLPSGGELYRSATSMTLAAVVSTQIGNLFAQRTERTSVFRAGFFTNRLVWVGIGAEIVLLLLIVYVPFLQKVFGTGRIPTEGWAFVIAWAPALLLADEARKALLRWRKT